MFPPKMRKADVAEHLGRNSTTSAYFVTSPPAYRRVALYSVVRNWQSRLAYAAARDVHLTDRTIPRWQTDYNGEDSAALPVADGSGKLVGLMICDFLDLLTKEFREIRGVPAREILRSRARA